MVLTNSTHNRLPLGLLSGKRFLCKDGGLPGSDEESTINTPSRRRGRPQEGLLRSRPGGGTNHGGRKNGGLPSRESIVATYRTDARTLGGGGWMHLREQH